MASQLEFHYPQPLLQYKIPQNVGIEDKIVGPFSLRQLIILGVGLGISYTLFAVSNKLYQLNVLEYIIIALPALLALAAALLKIRNVTFTKFILLSLEFAIRPKQRFWDHHGIAYLSSPVLVDKPSAKTSSKESDLAEKKRKNVNLAELSATLDSGGFKHVSGVAYEDLDRVDDDDLITQAYFGHRRKEGTAHNMYWRTRDVQKKKLDILAKLPKISASKPSQKPSLGESSLKVDEPVSSVTSEDFQEAESSDLLEEDVGFLLRVNINNREGGFNLLNQDAEVVEHVRVTNQKPESGLYKFAFKLKPGKYTIDFLPVQGYTLPAGQALNLLKNQKIDGIYQREKVQSIPKVERRKKDIELPKAKVEPVKKKRKRKKKNTMQVRNVIPVNTMEKPVPKEVNPIPSNEATTSISDLQSGGEIEFNLN